jgi:hypothetical protein
MREIDNKGAAAAPVADENLLRKEALTEFHRFMSGNLKHVDTDQNRVVSDKEFDTAIASGRYAGKQLSFLKAWKEESYDLSRHRMESFWGDSEVSRMDVFDFGLGIREYIGKRQQATAAASFLKDRFDAISGGGNLFLGELTSYRDKNPNLTVGDKSSLKYLIDHFSDAGYRPTTLRSNRIHYDTRRVRPDDVNEYVTSVDSFYRTHSDAYARIKDLR